MRAKRDANKGVTRTYYSIGNDMFKKANEHIIPRQDNQHGVELLNKLANTLNCWRWSFQRS